jgi:hypothetical protein
VGEEGGLKVTSEVAWISLRTYVHATEEQEKVLNAIRNLFPRELREKLSFKKNRLKGHFGNPIVSVEAKIIERELIEGFLKSLVKRLSKEDKKLLSDRINLHVHSGSLYIRLDKQAAYLGEIKLREADPIRVRVKFKRSSVILEACRKMGLVG